MNRYFLFLSILLIGFASCKAQKNSLMTGADSTQNQTTLIQEINAAGSKDVQSDSALHQLQNNSDLLLMHAVLNFAWARTITYTIIAQQNGIWKGYTYKVNMLKQNEKSFLNETGINSAACDSLLTYLTQNKAWKISGDAGRNFCDSANKNCTINDAATSQLLLVTKTNSINPSYYAPEFFEQCCPKADRALFVAVINKIDEAVSQNPTK